MEKILIYSKDIPKKCKSPQFEKINCPDFPWK